MDTIVIAGVSCRVDRLGSSLNYQKIYDMALLGGKKPADIDRELRENGFKPTEKSTESAQEGEPIVHRKPTKKRSPKKRKADNKSGEASMEKGSKSTE